MIAKLQKLGVWSGGFADCQTTEGRSEFGGFDDCQTSEGGSVVWRIF